MTRLYEKKDNLIRKNPNLTEEQKQEIIDLLARHPSSENKIDWNKNNKLTYEDFLDVLRPLYINDLDFRGLVKGEDYDLLLDKPKEKLYFIHTYNASKIIASNSVEPKLWTEIPSWCGREEFTDEAHAFGHFDEEYEDMKPGAKWCISIQTSDRYWNNYSKDFYFVFWIRDDESLGDNQKIALCIDKKNKRIATIYDASDNDISLNLPQYIVQAIDNYFKDIKEKEKRLVLSKFNLNLETGGYDYDGDLDSSILKDFVSEDRDGFTINFGKVTGSFNCSSLGLKSLKGAPTEVSKWFECTNNQLSSLEGAPQTVGSFYCYYNLLTSLKGAPQTVNGNFKCSYNHLTSLEGAPTKIGGTFNCSGNDLTSLEGAPQIVCGNFSCSSNQLTSLKGAPTKVGGGFNCSNNHLTSLEGVPQTIDGWFYCSNNKLTSLEGAPQIVGRDFYCYKNQLTSLEGAPTEVGGCFDCSWNDLTSLEGAPQKVGEWFDCHSNLDLHSLDGLGKIKGKIYKDF